MGLFDRINSFVKENIREPFINHLYDLGVRLGMNDNLSGSEIEAGLTNSIFDKVTRPIGDIISKFTQDADQFRYYSRIGFDEIPNTNSFRAVDWISADYGYVVEYDVYDTAGNYIGSQRSRIDTDEILTQNELFSTINDRFETSSGIELSDMENIRPLGALRKS